MAADRFELVRSIIYQCPALKMPQTFLQQLGMTAQIVPLKGLTQEQAQAIVDRLNTAPTLTNEQIDRLDAQHLGGFQTREKLHAFARACLLEACTPGVAIPQTPEEN
jgi:hypothetical protein